MITIEDILPTLHELFIEKLPLYIEKINKEKNDGIIILPFENKTLFENCQKLPCFKFEMLEAEYSEKDRIIENIVFEFMTEIKTKTNNITDNIDVYRYVKAIDKSIKNYNSKFLDFKIKKINKNKIYYNIIV